MDHSSSIQNVLPIPSPCPLDTSHQNGSEVPSSPPHSTDVGPPVLEGSPHDFHSPSITPQAMDPAISPSSDSD